MMSADVSCHNFYQISFFFLSAFGVGVFLVLVWQQREYPYHIAQRVTDYDVILLVALIKSLRNWN